MPPIQDANSLNIKLIMSVFISSVSSSWSLGSFARIGGVLKSIAMACQGLGGKDLMPQLSTVHLIKILGVSLLGKLCSMMLASRLLQTR